MNQTKQINKTVAAEPVSIFSVDALMVMLVAFRVGTALRVAYENALGFNVRRWLLGGELG